METLSKNATTYEKSFGYNNLTEVNPQIRSVFHDKEK